MLQKTKNTILIIFSVLTVATGQVMLKYGLNKVALDFQNNIAKSIIAVAGISWVWIGVALFASSSITWIMAMSKSDLSYGYPMMSLGYITVALLSWLLLNESLSALRMAGIAVVAAGVFMLSKS